MKCHRIQFDYEDIGFCRIYYKSVVSGNIFCFQEEYENDWLFYVCSLEGEPMTSVTPPNYLSPDRRA